MEIYFKFRLFLTTMPVFMFCGLATTYAETHSNLSPRKELSIPINLIHQFKNRTKYLQNIQDSLLGHLTDFQFASLPSAFLTFLPETFLTEVRPSQLAKVIKTHPNDAFLAMHIASAVKASRNKLEFIEKANKINTSITVQRILAASVTDMLNGNISKINETLLAPFVLHLPPTYLLQLNDSEIQKILYNLPQERLGHEISQQELRLWAKLSLKDDIHFKRVNWLISGLSEEDLERVFLSPDDFKQEFSIIQARAAFKNVYSNKTLDGSEFVECAVLQPKLTPLMLQRFPTHMETFSMFNLLPSPTSVATAKQILEIIVTNSMDKKKLTKDRFTWAERITYLKNWVYALPISVLRQYSQFTTLKSAVLAQIQSDLLTNLQAYHLTSMGLTMKLDVPTSVMDLNTLLSALPTTEISAHSVGDINSNVMEHILIHLPGNNIPRTVSLLTKVISSFDSRFFPSFLQNKDVSIYFNLISSKNIRHHASDMESNINKLNDIERANFQQLPPKILSVLLRTHRQDGIWTHDNFPYILINGINCDHISNMATTDFIVIMANYNKQRENFRQIFPKNLQYCCLQKLIDYLQLKLELQNVNANEGLISLLGPAEIVAVGGYVLMGLPLEAIEESRHQKLILATIGKLSVAELLLASNIINLHKLANLAVKQMFTTQFADYFELGNLVWFASPENLPVNFNQIFKLALESHVLDKRLCLNSNERRLWAIIFIQTFGPPEYWSSGTLNTLGDLLIVFSEDIFLQIPETTWVDAADTLQSNYSQLIEWFKPISFYKFCMAAIEESEKDSYLSAVKLLVRWQLWAAESQLSTIRNAPNISKSEIAMVTPSYKIENTQSTSTEAEEELFGYDSNEDYVEYSEESSDKSTLSDKKNKDTTTTQVSTSLKIVTSSGTMEDKTATDMYNSKTETNQESTPQTIRTSELFVSSTLGNEKELIIITTESINFTSTLTASTKPEKNNELEITKDKIITVNESANIEDTEKIQDNVTKHMKHKATMDIVTEPTISNQNELEEDMNLINKSGLSTTKAQDKFIKHMEQNTPTSLDITTENYELKEDKRLINGKNMKTSTEIIQLTTNETGKYNSKILDKNTTVKKEEIPSFTDIPNVINKIKSDRHEKHNSLISDGNVYTSKLEENSTITTNKTRKIESNIILPIGNLSIAIHKVDAAETNLHSNITKFVTNNEKVIDTPSPTQQNTTEDNDYDFDINPTDVIETDNSTIFDIVTRTRREVHIKQSNFTFSCSAIKMVGKVTELYLSSEVIDNKNFNQTELNECADILGNMDLSYEVTSNIWGRLDTDAKEPLHLMGNLLNVVSYRDITEAKLKLEEPWTLEAISELSQHINNTFMISTLVGKIKKRHFLDEFTVETLAALRSLICSFELEDLPQLKQEFHHIIVLLGTTTECLHCVSTIAEIAVSSSGFKDIGRWEVEDVVSMGSIVAGLNDTQWEELIQSPKNLVSGIQPQAVECLSQDKLMALKEKLPLLPPLSLASISEKQLAMLTSEQQSMVQDVKDLNIKIDIMPKRKESSGSAVKHSVSTLFTCFVFIYMFIIIYI